MENKINKKVLVTGGAGYIGSHAVYELIRSGYDVCILDKLSTGNRESIHSAAKFYEGDQKDKKILEKIFSENKIDMVMHFSAKLVVPESVEKPIEYFQNNVYGLSVLLEAMNKFNVKNIVFSSTAAVYGEPNNIPNDGIHEDSETIPINPYGESKLSCEWLIKSSKVAYGINYVIFRYFNVAGSDSSGQIGLSTKGRKLTHLVPVVVETALKQRKEMTIFGNDYNTRDKTCIRDYIHVTDLAKAHIKGMEYTLKGKSGIFNLGSSSGFSVKEIILATEKILNLNVNYKIGPRRKGDPAILVASNEKAKNLLGFKTEHSLEDIIRSDYNWRLNKKF